MSFKNTGTVVYNNKYITMESDHENIDCKNLLYIIYYSVDGYIIEGSSIEEINGDKYLILTSTNKNQKLLKMHRTLGKNSKSN